MKKAAKMVVRGTVQGVFFRQFIQENAIKLGLVGFVRNLENGNCEIIVEGEQNSIDRLRGIVNKGTKHSQIRQVEYEEKKWSGQFKDFKILRI